MDSEWFAPTALSSDMGRAALAFPWETTPLGPISSWGESLRQTARMCFSTRFPVMFVWGPELTMIYNDGYREMLGTQKRLTALGAPAREVWAEIWDEIGPWFEEVLTTRVPTWVVDAPLLINRSGFDEETYFTFSYSPLVDDDGAVVGVLDISTETTSQVVDRRRLSTVDTLHVAMQEHRGSIDELAGAVAVFLGGSADLSGCAVYLSEPGGPRLAATSDVAFLEQLPEGLVEKTLESGRPTVYERTFLAPLNHGGTTRTTGVLVLEAQPGRPFDASQRSFMMLTASAVGAAVRAADWQRTQIDYLRAHAELNEVRATRAREGSIALQHSLLTPPPAPDHLQIVVRYQPAGDDLEIGGDWYDAFLTKDGATTVVVGDVTGHDHQAAATMAQLRGVVRTVGYITAERPARVLEESDRAVLGLGLGTGATATAVVARIEKDERAERRGTRTLRWSNAGHPYPVVLRADGSVELLERRNDVLLGLLPDVERHDHSAELRDHDTLFLYTDGLVERRGVLLSESLALLTRTLEGQQNLTLDELADHVLATLAPGAESDDVALVLVRAFPEDEPRPAEAGPNRVPRPFR